MDNHFLLGNHDFKWCYPFACDTLLRSLVIRLLSEVIEIKMIVTIDSELIALSKLSKIVRLGFVGVLKRAFLLKCLLVEQHVRVILLRVVQHLHFLLSRHGLEPGFEPVHIIVLLNRDQLQIHILLTHLFLLKKSFVFMLPFK